MHDIFTEKQANNRMQCYNGARMNMKEETQALTQTHRSLFFVKKFLDEFPDAELYLVGGAVRDLFMKRKMLDVDFDFVIRRLPEKELEDWFSVLGEIDFVGRTFGVYKFIPEGMDPSRHHAVDIALPRTERAHPHSKGGYKEFDVQSDINLPLSEDLSRRDFTMNAMAINMRTGELVDPFGGERDIKQKLIRAVGNPSQRFDEDLSRMLRAIRFASELHFEIEPETQKAIVSNIARIQETRETSEGKQHIVPRETLGVELAKSLTRNPSRALALLTRTGAFEVIFGFSKPELPSEQIERLPEGYPTVTIALLLQSRTQEDITRILANSGLDSLPRGSRLRTEPQDVLWLNHRLRESWTPDTIRALPASTFEKFFMNGRGTLLTYALTVRGLNDSVSAVSTRRQEIQERWSVEAGEPIPPLISGNDVMEAGFPAGPKIRELLECVRTEQLDGRILTREQAKRWLQSKTP